MSFEEADALLSSNDFSLLEKELQNIVKDAGNIVLEQDTIIRRLLQCKQDAQVLQLTTQIIADLAKKEENRGLFTNKCIVEDLLTCIKSCNSVVYQALRAIGNVCFENEKACAIVGEEGLQTILLTINTYQEKGQEEIVSAGLGVTANIVATSEKLAKVSLSLNVLDVVENVLTKNEQNDAVTQQLLILLSSLTDEVTEVHQQQLKRLCYAVIKIMKTTENLEVGALCLEFLFSQAESRKLSCANIELYLQKNKFCFRTISDNFRRRRYL